MEGFEMRLFVRSIGMALLAIVAAVLTALTSTTTSVYTLAAATYILPGALGYPFTEQERIDLATPYITFVVGPPPPYDPSPLPPPGTIEPGSVIFGYSQGALVATDYKRAFNQQWANNENDAPNVNFVLLANPARPNGGTNSRLGLGATPTETAGADGITTYDIARQYDQPADYPLNPLNFLAVANANMGLIFLHQSYGSVDPDQEAVLQGTHGDTEYYLIPTYPLPLLMPLELIPGVGPVLADMLDPPLRVLVEAGYDRTINPGVPTPFNPLYFPDPVALAENFSLAIPTGWDNAFEDLELGRPFGTVRPGPYGVGGPPVEVATTPTTPAPLATAQAPQPESAGPSGNTNTATDATLQISAPAEQIDSTAPKPDTPSAVDDGSGMKNATSDDGLPTTKATRKAPSPSTQVGTRSAPPSISAPAGSKLPGAKHLVPSLKRAFGGPSAAAQGSDAGDGGANGGDGSGSTTGAAG
jgi:hypothetical protein